MAREGASLLPASRWARARESLESPRRGGETLTLGLGLPSGVSI